MRPKLNIGKNCCLSKKPIPLVIHKGECNNNPFSSNFAILYSPKKSWNYWFSDIFRRHRNGTSDQKVSPEQLPFSKPQIQIYRTNDKKYWWNSLKTIFVFFCKGYPSSFGCMMKPQYFPKDRLASLIQDQQTKHISVFV